MNILYFGKICDVDLFEEKEKKQQPFFVAQYMYEKALSNELLKDDDLNIEIVCIYQTEYYPNDKLIFNRNKNSKIDYLRFINLPYLRELTYFLSTCIFIIKWLLKHRNQKHKCIYSSCHFPPVSLAIVILGWLLSIKKIVTFTDLSLFTYSKSRIKKMKLYKKILIKPYLLIINKLQRSYDGYVLFSEQMNQIVNQKNRPHILIEGIYNSEHLNLKEVRNKSNVIAHAGTLNKEVGIEKILDVFNLIDNPDLELWLIGKGDMVNEIIKRSKSDNRIKYLGFLPRSTVFEKLKEAKLLVNLRNPEDIYTKFSFPSKMFEYMVSGTPVLTTKIGGIPEDYYNYLYFVEGDNNEVIKNKIIDIFSLNDTEKKELGMKAKKYILTEKGSVNQSRKIKKFLQDSIKY